MADVGETGMVEKGPDQRLADTFSAMFGPDDHVGEIGDDAMVGYCTAERDLLAMQEGCAAAPNARKRARSFRRCAPCPSSLP